MTLPPGDVDSGGGAGAITAGTLEGDDGGEVTDATGQPVEPQYQAALDAVNAAAADGDASSIDPTTALYAVMAQTPGVDDGVIQVAALAAPGGTALAAGVLANAGLISVTSETASASAADLPAVELLSAGPGGLTPAVSLEVESVSAWEAGWLQSPPPGGSGGTGGNGSPPNGGSDDNPTGDLVNSLYNLAQGLANPFGLGGVAANYANQLTQLGRLAYDAFQGFESLGPLVLHALFGTPASDPAPASSFMQGLEAAANQGQEWSYLGNTATSAVWNLATLPGRSFDAAGTAWAAFQQTGDLSPLVQWAATYGVALYGLGEGASAVAEGGAGPCRRRTRGRLARRRRGRRPGRGRRRWACRPMR